MAVPAMKALVLFLAVGHGAPTGVSLSNINVPLEKHLPAFISARSSSPHSGVATVPRGGVDIYARGLGESSASIASISDAIATALRGAGLVRQRGLGLGSDAGNEESGAGGSSDAGTAAATADNAGHAAAATAAGSAGAGQGGSRYGNGALGGIGNTAAAVAANLASIASNVAMGAAGGMSPAGTGRGRSLARRQSSSSDDDDDDSQDKSFVELFGADVTDVTDALGAGALVRAYGQALGALDDTFVGIAKAYHADQRGDSAAEDDAAAKAGAEVAQRLVAFLKGEHGTTGSTADGTAVGAAGEGARK